MLRRSASTRVIWNSLATPRGVTLEILIRTGNMMLESGELFQQPEPVSTQCQSTPSGLKPLDSKMDLRTGSGCQTTYLWETTFYHSDGIAGSPPKSGTPAPTSGL